MKKFLIAFATLATSVCANAEAFGGGTIGLDVIHLSQYSTTKTMFAITPEMGYSFNKTWAIGAQVGYGLTSTDATTTHSLSVMPFVRATFASVGKVDFFGEFAGGYCYLSESGDGVNGAILSLRPGIAINFTPKFALIARTTLIQYEHFDGADAVEFALNKGFGLGAIFKF